MMEVDCADDKPDSKVDMVGSVEKNPSLIRRLSSAWDRESDLPKLVKHIKAADKRTWVNLDDSQRRRGEMLLQCALTKVISDVDARHSKQDTSIIENLSKNVIDSLNRLLVPPEPEKVRRRRSIPLQSSVSSSSSLSSTRLTHEQKDLYQILSNNMLMHLAQAEMIQAEASLAAYHVALSKLNDQNSEIGIDEIGSPLSNAVEFLVPIAVKMDTRWDDSFPVLPRFRAVCSSLNQKDGTLFNACRRLRYIDSVVEQFNFISSLLDELE